MYLWMLILIGSLSGNGNISCWQTFSYTRDAIQEAFCNLRPMSLESTVKDALEEYVCKLYQPDANIVRLTELRWWMFWIKKSNCKKTTSSRASFLEGVKRAQYQFIIWKSAADIKADKPTPGNYGCKRDCIKYISVMTTLPLSAADKMWLQQVCMLNILVLEQRLAFILYQFVVLWSTRGPM